MATEKTYDRFDLEQAFMMCWQTVDDLKLLSEMVTEDALDTDKIANAVMGIELLHEMRCKKTMDIFEHVVSNGELDNDTDID
jgi:hypothetical protein